MFRHALICSFLPGKSLVVGVRRVITLAVNGQSASGQVVSPSVGVMKALPNSFTTVSTADVTINTHEQVGLPLNVQFVMDDHPDKGPADQLIGSFANQSTSCMVFQLSGSDASLIQAVEVYFGPCPATLSLRRSIKAYESGGMMGGWVYRRRSCRSSFFVQFVAKTQVGAFVPSRVVSPLGYLCLCVARLPYQLGINGAVNFVIRRGYGNPVLQQADG